MTQTWEQPRGIDQAKDLTGCPHPRLSANYDWEQPQDGKTTQQYLMAIQCHTCGETLYSRERDLK